MSKTVLIRCRICLRSDFDTNTDTEEVLEDFHDELCDFDAYPQAGLKFCPMCECLLRKFYNFKEKCQRANNMLKAYRKKNLQVMETLSPLRISNGHNQRVECLSSEDQNFDPNQNNVTIDILTNKNIAQLVPSKPTDSEIILANQNSNKILINFSKDEREEVSQMKHNPYTDEFQISIVKEEVTEDSETDKDSGSHEYISRVEITIKQDQDYILESETTHAEIEQTKKGYINIEIEPTVNSPMKLEKEAMTESLGKVTNKNSRSKGATLKRSGVPLNDYDTDDEDNKKGRRILLN